jgi:5-methylcytosine-specific restriction endonuclease McrA
MSVAQKACTRCNQIKPLSEYQKRASSPDGHAWHCKACQSVYDQERKARKAERWRERYATDPAFREKMKARIKRIYATDAKYRDATIARATAWDKAHPDRVNANTRRRYWAGYRFVERAKKSTEEYRVARRERLGRQMRENEALRLRARHRMKLHKYKLRGILKDAGTFTQDEWQALCNYYGNKCLCCGRGDAPLTVDHIVPLTRRGRNTIDNLQPLCGTCNTRKNARTIDYRPDGGAHLYKQERLF